MEYLTIQQVADRLGVNPTTIRRRIKKGVINAKKMQGEFGEQYFITMEEVKRHEVISESVEVIELQKALTPIEVQKTILQAIDKANEPLLKEIQELKKMVEVLTESKDEKKKSFFWNLFNKK